MTTSDNLKVYLPHAARTKRNFVRSRLRAYLKDLICANGYEVTGTYNSKLNIIHYPSALDFLENDSPVKEKHGNKKYIINAFTNVNEFEMADNGIPHLKKDVLSILNNAFTVVVFFETQKIALRHLGVTSPIQVIYPIARDIVEDTDIFKTAFYQANGLLPTQKYIVNIGNYENESGITEYESLARIMPDLEFYFYGNRHPLFSNTKRYEESKAIPNIHFEDYPAEELLPAMINSMTALVITGINFFDCLFLADCMKKRIPIVIRSNKGIVDMVENHALIADNLDQFYEAIHGLLENNKVEDAYQFISDITIDTEKDKLARIYDKYQKL